MLRLTVGVKRLWLTFEFDDFNFAKTSTKKNGKYRKNDNKNLP